MKQLVTLILTLILILIIFPACGTQTISLSDVEYVILTLGGPEQGEHTIAVFYKPENIKKLLKIEDQLSQGDPEKNKTGTLNLDVVIEYYLKNGESKKKMYKDIEAVDEYLQDIYNCQEYKEQIIPLFKLDKGEDKKI